MSIKKKIIMIVCIIAIIIVIIISIAGYMIGNYFYNLALNPSTDKSVIFSSPQNALEQNSSSQTREFIDAWFNQTNHSSQYIQSRDALTLHSYQIIHENPTANWIIMCHGYTAKADDMIATAWQFYNLGYNILLPDARGHGNSEGHYIGMGWHERLDLVDWVDHIIGNQSDAQIVLYGVSMGGATVMMASGEQLPSNVKAIVQDCGYTSVRDIFSYQLQETFNLPSFPIMNFASIVTRFRAGYSLEEASAIEQVRKSQTPILFVHGDEDTFVPYPMVEELYEAATVEKEIFIVSGAGHGQASAIAREEYWDTVDSFINRYID